jgi:lysozyme
MEIAMTNVPAGAAMPVELIEVDYDIALEIAGHEAVIRETYRDSVGKDTWSVGLTSATGHDVTRYIGKPQPLEHCLAVYVWALREYAVGVRKAFAGMKLTKAQFAAALSFHWNTGKIGKASWVKRFKAGDIAGAREAFMLYRKPPEIEGRREKERDLFFDGVWSNDGTMTEYTRLTRKRTPVWKSAVRIDVREILRAAIASAAAPELDHAPQPNAVPGAPTLSPPQPRPAQERPLPAPAAADPPDPDTVRDLQRRLHELGYTEVGNADGDLGPLTEAAILAFRNDNGLPLTPAIDDELLAAVMKAAPRELAPERTDAKPKEVRQQAPEVAANWWTKIVALVVAGLSMLTAAIDWLQANLGEVRALIKPVTDLLGDVPPWLYAVIFAAGCGLVYWRSRKGELAGLEAVRTGARR